MFESEVFFSDLRVIIDDNVNGIWVLVGKKVNFG